MIRINLLAPEIRAARKGLLPAGQRATLLGLLMLMATATGVGVWWWTLQRQAVALDTKIATADRELTRLKDISKMVDRAIARKAELSEKVSLIDRLRAAQRGPVNLLSIVSTSLPDGTWLMEINQKGPSVQIEGRATSLTSVTDFVERLQSSGIFDRPVEIVSTGMETIEDASVVRFAVKAQAAGTAAAAAKAAAAAPVKKGD